MAYRRADVPPSHRIPAPRPHRCVVSEAIHRDTNMGDIRDPERNEIVSDHLDLVGGGEHSDSQ